MAAPPKMTKQEIEKQAEEIEAAAEASSDEESSDDEEEEGILNRHIKQNERSKAESFTLLYWVVSIVTVFCPTYLFITIMEFSPYELLNAGIYLVAAGATCYFLVEGYKQMYDTESRKAAQGDDGKALSVHEKRLHEKVAQLGTQDASELPPLAPGQTKHRQPQEIYMSERTGAAEWKTLRDEEQREYKNRSVAEEVQILRNTIADFKHLQTQSAMGWSLFFCNVVFIAISCVVSLGLLRAYDPRIGYPASTVLTGLFVQLLAKHNDEAAKSRTAKARK